MTTDATHAKPRQLTAMISSTALDLPEHRAAVKEACVSAGVLPKGMEHLPARDATGIAVSLEMVDQADLYLGIYAWRYGWVPDGKDISITEMEFDHAVARKAADKLREILVFTAHDDHPFTKKDIETGDIPQQKLAAFKTKAATGRVRKEFKSVEELHRLVSNALHEFRHRQDASAVRHSSFVTPHSSIPNNLPRLQPFFGREKELADIAKALDPMSRTWGTLVDGTGGIGKTALAVRAAYDCPPEHFGRVVFVSLKQKRQDDDKMRSLGRFAFSSWPQTLNEIARALELPQVAQAPMEERAVHLRYALEGHRVLLVLDNLETLPPDEQDELFNFLEVLPSGCKALLTSRIFAGNRLLAMELKQLDQTAALQMLAEIAEHNPPLAAASAEDRLSLYSQTCGNVLLLRWIAGQIGREDCTSIADALKRLGTCPPDNDPLEFIFGDLLASFTVEEVRLLATLSFPSQPLALSAIAEISTVPEADSHRLLKALSNRSLVVPDQDESAYSLVPMVAEFMRKSRPKVVRETGDRLEKRAYALIMENGGQEHARFPELEAAWPGIAPALALFLTGDNPRLQNVCEALQYFLEFSGRWDAWFLLSVKAEAAAASSGDYENAARRAHNAGWIHYLRREASQLLDCADREANFWKAAQAGPCEQASAIRLHGLGHHLQNNHSAAIGDYDKALQLYRSVPPDQMQNFPARESDLAIVLNYLGEAHRSLGQLEEAERNYSAALAAAKGSRFEEGVACFTGDLADLAIDRQDWANAETLAREALPLSEAVHRQELIARNNRVLAHALLRQGKFPEALPHARRAVAIYTRLGSPDLAKALTTLAECEQALAAK